MLKRGYLLQSTEEGQVSLTTGIWIVLFLSVLLSGVIQMALFRCTSQYLEDALAASNLAAAVIDVEEYGMTHRIKFGEYDNVYKRFQEALRENLNLDENGECPNKGIISGVVRVERFIVYEVWKEEVRILECDGQGGVTESLGVLGEVRAPNGKKIESTGIYSEITCPIKGIFALETTAHKAQLVDIVRKDTGE